MGKISANLGTTLLLDKPVNIFVVEPKNVANISVIPQYAGAEANFSVGAGAGAHIVFPVLPQTGKFRVVVAEDARVTLSLVGRDNLDHDLDFMVALAGSGANVHFQIAVIHLTASQSKFDCQLLHKSPRTYARLVSRRIVLDGSRSALKGVLNVATTAQGADTYLSDKALLLGEMSGATSDPQLEISANEVKASHGATIGKLPAEELFYIQSR